MADERPAALAVGTEFELAVERVASGGSCVGHQDGRVVFVRHALPGERVRVRVTEDRGGSFLRADAVDVLQAAPERVPAPCRYAHPGGCGGCDWQHASAEAQRELKAAVIRDQFARIGGIDLVDGPAERFAGVEALPGGLLGWRNRIVYAVDDDGRLGLHRHHERTVQPIDRCLIGAPGVGDAVALTGRWPGVTGVEIVAGVGGFDAEATVLTHRPGPGRQARGRRPPDRVSVVSGPEVSRYHVRHREFAVTAGGFWQAHRHAAEVLLDAVLAAAELRPGQRVLELYAGSGAFTAFLAEAVGATGRVVSLESAPSAVADAVANLADLPWAEPMRARVSVATVRDVGRVDLVVLDPPRAGVGPEILAAVLALKPRRVVYVSCDAATLARDVRAARDHGWRMTSLRAFDAFPMTAHVECVAVLTAGESDGPTAGLTAG